MRHVYLISSYSHIFFYFFYIKITTFSDTLYIKFPYLGEVCLIQLALSSLNFNDWSSLLVMIQVQQDPITRKEDGAPCP